MKRRRIIVNNDYYNIFQVAPPVTDQDVYDAVDRMVAPATPGGARQPGGLALPPRG